MAEKEFIAQIAPIIKKYAKEYGYWVISPIIAQACIESGYGKSTLSSKYHNYFGLKCGSGWKGASVNMKTNEEYSPGTLTAIRDNFRAYPDMDAGVRGYFDFIQYPRYKNVRQATTAKQYLEAIKAAGYATSSTYVNTCMRVVNQYDLTKYDGETITEHIVMPTIKKVAYAGQVTASGLNVRTGPSTHYDIMQVKDQNVILPRGICVAFEAECEGWGKLAGVDGWCSLQYIQH